MGFVYVCGAFIYKRSAKGYLFSFLDFTNCPVDEFMTQFLDYAGELGGIAGALVSTKQYKNACK